MSSTASSSSNFQSILDVALSDYAKQTSIDLPTHPFAQSLQNCDSPERILDLLGEKAKQFQAYRDGNRKLINCLKPVVQILHAVSGILGEASSMVRPTELVSSYVIVSLWFDI
jgi:fungal STAND N-terminal Goodbye domain